MTRITFTDLHTGKRLTTYFFSRKVAESILNQLPAECEAEIKPKS